MDAIKRNRAGLALAIAAAGVLGAQSAMAAPKKVPAAPQAKPAIHAVKHRAVRVVRQVPLPRKRPLPAAAASAPGPSKVALRGPVAVSPAMFSPVPQAQSGHFEPAPAAPATSAAATAPADIAAVKQVIEAARKGREADADAAARTISNPAARKLAEWAILRSDNTNPSFERYAAFVTANPGWPHVAAIPPARRERAVERWRQ